MLAEKGVDTFLCGVGHGEATGGHELIK